MTPQSAKLIGVAVALASVATAAMRQETPRQDRSPVFRARTDLSSAFVSVRQRNRPVAGLKPEDFLLTDNGVRQTIESAWIETLPIDVTVVLDTSGSLAGAAFAQLQQDVAELGSLLRAEDRVRVLAFSAVVQEVSPMAPVHTPTRATSLVAGGATAFFNAIAAAILAPDEPGRPHLVVVFSDGSDNASWLDDGDVRDLAGRTGAVLYAIIRTNSGIPSLRVPFQASRWLPWDGSLRLRGVGDAAGITGGRLTRVPAKASITKLLQETIQEFRTSYVQWYQPAGRPAAGWHDLKIVVPKGNYDLSARRGYFVDR